MPGRDPCQAIQELLETMHTLRAPGGCPWDAEQTPASLAPYILEEACEVIEAIECGTPETVADELGDLLLQIVFQAEIFAGRGEFDFADVAVGINEKLVRRHPHVFSPGDTPVSPGQLDEQWERIKREERQAGNGNRAEHGLPGRLPALQRAQKLIARAMRSGSPLPPLPTTGHAGLTEESLGIAIFRLVQQAEHVGVDAEQALRKVLRHTLREGDPPSP